MAESEYQDRGGVRGAVDIYRSVLSGLGLAAVGETECFLADIVVRVRNVAKGIGAGINRVSEILDDATNQK